MDVFYMNQRQLHGLRFLQNKLHRISMSDITKIRSMDMVYQQITGGQRNIV